MEIRKRQFSSSKSLVLITIVSSIVWHSECVGANDPMGDDYDEHSGDQALPEINRIRTVVVALLLGGVFLSLLAILTCCMFCPCSFCILSARRRSGGVSGSNEDVYERGNPPFQNPTTPQRAMTVSSIVIVCDNPNYSHSAEYTNFGIRDPPPPYPGKGHRTGQPLKHITLDEHPPPPYSPSL